MYGRYEGVCKRLPWGLKGRCAHTLGEDYFPLGISLLTMTPCFKSPKPTGLKRYHFND